MIVPHWPYPQRPLPGELLSSCIARNAAAHGRSAYSFLALFWQRRPAWERDFDRNPASLGQGNTLSNTPDWLTDLSRAMRVSRHALEQATLAPWRTLLGEIHNPAAGDTPLVLSAGVFHRTRTRHSLQFCPDCLADPVPYFRKTWRLGFVVSCSRHARPLLDACSWCDAPVIPHRSMTARLTDCHRCGRPIAGRLRTRPEAVPPAVCTLQDRLMGLLDRRECHGQGLLGTEQAFATVHALLSASAPARSQMLLRRALGLEDEGSEPSGRRRFEHSRHAARVSWLETLAAWMESWPDRFIAGADGMGASQRTFIRSRLPPSFAAQVARLPTRRRSRPDWQPLLDEPALRRLRRTDRAAYHAERARRVLSAIGR